MHREVGTQSIWFGLAPPPRDSPLSEGVVVLVMYNTPLFVMSVWSSVRSGLLFSHWMYFFHISTCWASWGEFWGGTEGALRSSPFITVSYSWEGQRFNNQPTARGGAAARVAVCYISVSKTSAPHLRHPPGVHVVPAAILNHLLGQVYIDALFRKAQRSEVMIHPRSSR